MFFPWISILDSLDKTRQNHIRIPFCMKCQLEHHLPHKGCLIFSFFFLLLFIVMCWSVVDKPGVFCLAMFLLPVCGYFIYRFSNRKGRIIPIEYSTFRNQYKYYIYNGYIYDFIKMKIDEEGAS